MHVCFITLKIELNGNNWPPFIEIKREVWGLQKQAKFKK